MQLASDLSSDAEQPEKGGAAKNSEDNEDGLVGYEL